ncbi:MAG: hypothetical protein JWO62_2046 [Acidimicrobiaceae bacterium]|jgi:hypothetical protein|nr:hypothetical protein [Acidimicrobiaceae bacterium]
MTIPPQSTEPDEEVPSTERTRPSRRAVFERRYGGGPGHLLSMIVGLSVAGYVVSILAGVGHRFEILLWVAGAIVAHDILLFPLYTAADAFAHWVHHPRGTTPPLVPWRNHVRAPLAISALLLAMTFPLVFRLSESSYHRATGLTTAIYASHWLIVSGALFVGSGLLYFLRYLFARSRANRSVPPTRP